MVVKMLGFFGGAATQRPCLQALERSMSKIGVVASTGGVPFRVASSYGLLLGDVGPFHSAIVHLIEEQRIGHPVRCVALFDAAQQQQHANRSTPG